MPPENERRPDQGAPQDVVVPGGPNQQQEDNALVKGLQPVSAFPSAISAEEFLTELFGDAVGENAQITIFSGKRTTWCSSIPDAVKAVEMLDKKTDVYFGVALQDRDRARAIAKEKRNDPDSTRGYSNTTVAIGGVWVDIDIACDGHAKPGLPTSIVAVLAELDKLPLKPTFVFVTGGGVHAWWLFKEPWILGSDDERMRATTLLAGWQAFLRKTTGWTIDATHDLARVLRLPGTRNHKRGVTVEVAVNEPARRYSPSDFEDWLVRPQRVSTPAAAHSESFTLSADARPPEPKFHVLLDLDPKFAATWKRERPEFPSQSEYDMSLASTAAHAGWSDQEIVDLLVAHRREGGGDLDLVDLERKFRNHTLPKARAEVSVPAPTGQGSMKDGPSVPAAARHPDRVQGSFWPEPPRPEAFHGLVGEFVRTIGPHTEADGVALLVQFLVAFGSAVNRGPLCLVGGTRHHLNEFVVLVGDTSKARKGTAWNEVRRIFSRADELWDKNCVAHGLSSGEGLIWSVRDEIRRREKNKKGVYEEVVVDPGVADKRLLVVESEFASTLRVLGREGNTLSAVLRNAWDMGDLRSLTKNSPARATGAHVSIVAHITKDEFLRELDRTEAANGFGNRFIFVAVRRSKFLPEGGSLSDADINPLVQKINHALRHARATTELKRDESARALWFKVYPKLSEGRPGLCGALTARAEAHVLRLSMLYALLDGASMIREEHLRAALALWDYCERSTRFIFGDALGDALADEILRVLRVSPHGCSKTDLHSHFGRHPASRRLDAALRTLLSQGLVARSERVTGGRPAEIWTAVAHERPPVGDGPLPSLTSLLSQSTPPHSAATASSATQDAPKQQLSIDSFTTSVMATFEGEPVEVEPSSFRGAIRDEHELVAGTGAAREESEGSDQRVDPDHPSVGATGVGQGQVRSSGRDEATRADERAHSARGVKPTGPTVAQGDIRFTPPAEGAVHDA